MPCYFNKLIYIFVVLCRNIQFFGEEGQLKVHCSFVVVVGLGGVGSHAAAMLLRCGVGKLRLIDFDQVTSPLKAWRCVYMGYLYKPTKPRKALE